MFAESLLESSSGRKRKRWPVATAFTVQTIIAAVVVIVPLLSTGVIPLSARMHVVAPIPQAPLEENKPVTRNTSSHSGPSVARSERVVLLANNNPNVLRIGPPVPTTEKPEEVRLNGYVGPRNLPDDLVRRGSEDGSDVKPEIKRVRSQLTEAQLINRVDPVYPRPAVLAGIQGQVKLHAIIARNGRIESLELISGHPMLVQAALEAVRQWRYRPYYLNGEAVEVETFITVNFTREQR
ncbi:MAG TPA: energy transducer TonB [Candidatus Angelobacter sp.]|nr:energy transducer TonB [Candidatus Angelobacter sp.]